MTSRLRDLCTEQTHFDLLAVPAMLVRYAVEDRLPRWVMSFAIACVLGSAYGLLQGARPFGVVAAIWCLVAINRWRLKQWPRSRSQG